MQRLLPCLSEPAVAASDEEEHGADAHAVMGQAATPLQAWQNRKITLGFSGGGFLLPYHLGVYQGLATMGIVDASSPMAGASAGSLAVTGIKCGLSIQQQMESFLEAAHECRRAGLTGRLRAVLKAQLQRTFPPDAHVRCSDGTCWLSVTQVMPRPANKLYGAFETRDQLIKALLTSCHLPRLSDGGLFTSYKSVHKRCFDGGFSNLVPVPPVPPPRFSTPTAATEGITAATAAASAPAAAAELPTASNAPVLVYQHSTKGIRTQLTAFKRNRSHSSSSSTAKHHVLSLHSKSSSSSRNSSATSSNSWGDLAASCLVTGPGAYVAAEGWFAVRICVLPSQHLDSLPAMLRAPSAAEVSIALDKFQPWPHDMQQTTNLALYPQDDGFLWDLFERGRADALTWAQQQGFPEHVLQRMGDAEKLPMDLQYERPTAQQQQQHGALDVQQQAEAVAAAAAGVTEAKAATDALKQR